MDQGHGTTRLGALVNGSGTWNKMGAEYCKIHYPCAYLVFLLLQLMFMTFDAPWDRCAPLA